MVCVRRGDDLLGSGNAVFVQTLSSVAICFDLLAAAVLLVQLIN